MKTLEAIYKDKIIAIVRGIAYSSMADTARALLDGGIHMMEVTFDQSGTEGIQRSADSIRLLANQFPNEILLGAGTVLTPDQVQLAYNCGAAYIISPNVDVDVIRKTKDLGMISIPGAFTPSEIAIAYKAGADIVKLFPAGLLGISYIKAVRGPLSHIPITAVGGINETNIHSFFEAGVCGVGIGNNLVNPQAVQKGDFAIVTKTAKTLVAALIEG